MKKSIILVLEATFAFIFTACGDGNELCIENNNSTTVTVLDGYIKDANLSDAAGQSGIYTSNGQYAFADTVAYPLTCVGGKLEDTNNSFDINMSAQSGLILSPITTFLSNNPILLDKFVGLDLQNDPTTFEDFSIDYIDTNNTDLAKLSQLLYAIQKDSNLTFSFKTSLANSNPTTLNELFALAEADVNATMGSYAKSYNIFLNKVKNLNVSASAYETELETEKINLSYIIHNGTRYDIVISPYTGRVWLDRNLGASRLCTDYNDTACYGDYYEWGRNFDGHEKSDSQVTSTLATDVNNAGSYFIQNTNYYSGFDWASVDTDGSQRKANWRKTDGSSICPVGYHVPTLEELKAEITDQGVSGNIAAFNNFLKLPSAGYRWYGDALMHGSGTSAVYTTSDSVVINNGSTIYGAYRAEGYPIRCIKSN